MKWVREFESGEWVVFMETDQEGEEKQSATYSFLEGCAPL